MIFCLVAPRLENRSRMRSLELVVASHFNTFDYVAFRCRRNSSHTLTITQFDVTAFLTRLTCLSFSLSLSLGLCLSLSICLPLSLFRFSFSFCFFSSFLIGFFHNFNKNFFFSFSFFSLSFFSLSLSSRLLVVVSSRYSYLDCLALMCKSTTISLFHASLFDACAGRDCMIRDFMIRDFDII